VIKAPRPSDEDGETLIEILMTLVIIGICGVGLIAGLTTLVISTETHRRLSDVEVSARSYAESVKNLLLRPASTTLTASVDGHSPADPLTLQVTSTAQFPAPPFDVAVDTEVVHITAKTATTMSGTAGAGEGHPVNAIVTRYVGCPTIADVMPTLSATQIAQLQAAKLYTAGVSPSVTGLELFDTGSAAVAPAACPGYWNRPASVCSVTGWHTTDCDPRLIRVTVAVTSTDSAESRGAKTVTSVLVRRTA
jgi:type II secretory pathway pseudopilin PulG